MYRWTLSWSRLRLFDAKVACCSDWQIRKNPHSSCRKAQIIIYIFYLRRDSDFLVFSIRAPQPHQNKRFFMTVSRAQAPAWLSISPPPQTAGGSFYFLNLHCPIMLLSPFIKDFIKAVSESLKELVRCGMSFVASNHHHLAVLQTRVFPVPREMIGYHIISR